MGRMKWPPLEGIDPPCCRACGREPVLNHLNLGFLTLRDDGDLDLEPNFPVCDRCWGIACCSDAPQDAVDEIVLELSKAQGALLKSAKGRTMHMSDGTTFPIR